MPDTAICTSTTITTRSVSAYRRKTAETSPSKTPTAGDHQCHFPRRANRGELAIATISENCRSRVSKLRDEAVVSQSSLSSKTSTPRAPSRSIAETSDNDARDHHPPTEIKAPSPSFFGRHRGAGVRPIPQVAHLRQKPKNNPQRNGGHGPHGPIVNECAVSQRQDDGERHGKDGTGRQPPSPTPTLTSCSRSLDHNAALLTP